MRVRIAVTNRDIERGERHTCRFCPIARALNRLLRPHLFAFVADRSCIVTLDEQGWEVWDGAIPMALPQAVMAWRDAFDRGHDVPTLTFVIDIPDSCLLRVA